MSFMEREITVKQSWIVVDGFQGTEYIPEDVVTWQPEWEYEGTLIPVPAELRDYCTNASVFSIKKIEGYGARLSAPGYMDCTEWSVFDSEKEAETYLEESFGDD